MKYLIKTKTDIIYETDSFKEFRFYIISVFKKENIELVAESDGDHLQEKPQSYIDNLQYDENL